MSAIAQQQESVHGFRLLHLEVTRIGRVHWVWTDSGSNQHVWGWLKVVTVPVAKDFGNHCHVCGAACRGFQRLHRQHR